MVEGALTSPPHSIPPPRILPQRNWGANGGRCVYIYIHVFTYIWVIFRANVSKYFIHGAYGNDFEYDFGELVGDEGHVYFRLIAFQPMKLDHILQEVSIWS
jgi:hypothetical protein